MGRLSDFYPKPVDGDDDLNEREATSVGSRPYPIGIPTAKRHSFVGVTLSNFQAQFVERSKRSFLFVRRDRRLPTRPLPFSRATRKLSAYSESPPHAKPMRPPEEKAKVAAFVPLKNLVMGRPRPPTPHRQRGKIPSAIGGQGRRDPRCAQKVARPRDNPAYSVCITRALHELALDRHVGVHDANGFYLIQAAYRRALETVARTAAMTNQMLRPDPDLYTPERIFGRFMHHRFGHIAVLEASGDRQAADPDRFEF